MAFIKNKRNLGEKIMVEYNKFMKILFLTVSDQQHHPLNKYIDLHCNYDFRSWESGFRAICPNVYILDYYASFVSTGPFGMERRILELVRKNNIQLLIVPNMYYELAPTFLNELRTLGCKSLVVFFDDSMRFEDTNRFYLSSFDYYLTHESDDSKELYRPYGIDAEFFPIAPSRSFYGEIIQSLDKTSVEHANDVVFIGAKIADRDVFIDCLKNNGVNISVYGRGWDAGMLSSEEMIAAYNSSKISLNFLKAIGSSGRVQLKGRLFEIILAGGFVLSEFSEELTDYFDIGREIDTFRSSQELLDKVRFYLEHSTLREEMSARAREKVEKHYSFETNWLRYFTDIKNSTLKTFYPNTGYKVPAVAINGFLSWNFSFIHGRFMLGQFGLAYQQYKFCHREIEALECNISINKWFLKLAARRFITMAARRIISRKHRLRIRKEYSRFRGLITNWAIRRQILPKLNEINISFMADGESLFQEVANRISEFIKKRKVSGKNFEYLYSENSNQTTLYSSAYACMTLSLLGRLNELTADQKSRWIEYFDTFQIADDGLFYDPVVHNEIYADTDWWGARHLALHMISAYTDLGGKPQYPFRFLEHYYKPTRIATWLDAFDWQSSIGLTNDIDNKIMNIGCLLQYQRDTWGDAKAGDSVRYLQQYLKDRINPETGMWGKWHTHDPHQRSRMVQFAYHLFPLFLYDKQKLGHPDLIADQILKTQNIYGGFGVQANSSSCEDIDSIDILCRLAPDVPECKTDIDESLHRAWKWVLCNQVEDGGFVFRLFEPFTYGHSEMSSGANQGAMFPTWFRLLSLAYLNRYFSQHELFTINSCPGYEFEAFQ